MDDGAGNLSFLCARDQRLEHALNHQFLRGQQIRIFRVLGLEIGFAVLFQERLQRALAVDQGRDHVSMARFRPVLQHHDVFNMMRNLGGAIGIAVCATLLNDRTNLHFLCLAEHLDTTNAAMREMLHKVSTHFAALNGGDIIHGQATALKQLWSLTLREAQVQTFADAFRVIAVCFVIATVMVSLLRKVALPTAAVADAH